MWNKFEIIVLLLTVFVVIPVRPTDEQKEDSANEEYDGESNVEHGTNEGHNSRSRGG